MVRHVNSGDFSLKVVKKTERHDHCSFCVSHLMFCYVETRASNQRSIINGWLNLSDNFWWWKLFPFSTWVHLGLFLLNLTSSHISLFLLLCYRWMFFLTVQKVWYQLKKFGYDINQMKYRLRGKASYYSILLKPSTSEESAMKVV